MTVAAARSRPLATLAVATVLIYVVTSPLHLWGSITLGDVWMLPVTAVLLMTDRAAARVLEIVRGAYGAIALVLTTLLLVAALNASDVPRSLVFILQLAFTVWLVIPLVAAGVASLRDPWRVLRAMAAAYLACYAVGLVLLFGFGNEAILYQTAIGRVFSRYATHGLQLVLMALATTGIAVAQRGAHRVGYLLLLVLSLVPVLLGVNRTWLATLLLLALIAAAEALRTRRGFAILLVSLALVFAVGYGAATSPLVEELAQVRVVTIAGLLEDHARLAAISTSLAEIRGHVSTLLFGSGWGTSGMGADIVVHNFVIQVTNEAGLLVLLALTPLLLLPAIWALEAPHAGRTHRTFVLMLTGGVVLFWSLNALVVERSYWLAYAIALGIAHGARRQRVAVTAAPEPAPA